MRMNTTPHATTILCYGASNTYGQKPDRSGRYAANERWTGILQNALGSTFYIIEEGLNGRTTDLEHPNPTKPNRNGLTYFKACLESHMPLSAIIVMLGTNDRKRPTIAQLRTSQKPSDTILSMCVNCVQYVHCQCQKSSLSVHRTWIVRPHNLLIRCRQLVYMMKHLIRNPTSLGSS